MPAKNCAHIWNHPSLLGESHRSSRAGSAIGSVTMIATRLTTSRTPRRSPGLSSSNGDVAALFFESCAMQGLLGNDDARRDLECRQSVGAELTETSFEFTCRLGILQTNLGGDNLAGQRV